VEYRTRSRICRRRRQKNAKPSTPNAAKLESGGAGTATLVSVQVPGAPLILAEAPVGDWPRSRRNVGGLGSSIVWMVASGVVARVAKTSHPVITPVALVVYSNRELIVVWALVIV
jgi:hypothetical protein